MRTLARGRAPLLEIDTGIMLLCATLVIAVVGLYLAGYPIPMWGVAATVILSLAVALAIGVARARSNRLRTGRA